MSTVESTTAAPPAPARNTERRSSEPFTAQVIPGDDARDPEPAGDDPRAGAVEQAGDDEAEHGAELKRVGEPRLAR